MELNEKLYNHLLKMVNDEKSTVQEYRNSYEVSRGKYTLQIYKENMCENSYVANLMECGFLHIKNEKDLSGPISDEGLEKLYDLIELRYYKHKIDLVKEEERKNNSFFEKFIKYIGK